MSFIEVKRVGDKIVIAVDLKSANLLLGACMVDASRYPQLVKSGTEPLLPLIEALVNAVNDFDPPKSGAV